MPDLEIDSSTLFPKPEQQISDERKARTRKRNFEGTINVQTKKKNKRILRKEKVQKGIKYTRQNLRQKKYKGKETNPKKKTKKKH